MTDLSGLSALRLSDRLAAAVSPRSAAGMSYWRARPPLPAVLEYPLEPELRRPDRAAVRLLKRGVFQPVSHFPPVRTGLPPPWGVNPFGDKTYDFHRHALRWTVPLVKVWRVEQDGESLELAQRVIEDWIVRNAEYPGESPLAWDDHASAQRARVLCWFFELWRRGGAADERLGRLLLASICQHAAFLSSDWFYNPRHNHALQMDMSLLAIAIGFPEFRQAREWARVAQRRLAAYVECNFSPLGFNLEQSPSYHFYTTLNLATLCGFLRSCGREIPPLLAETVERAVRVAPHLIRPDGRVPNVGDTDDYASAAWRATLERAFGAALPGGSERGAPSPRGDAAEMLVDPCAGYAVFRAAPADSGPPAPDTYVLFRCNAWCHSWHCHPDALSFELFGLGREWLVDSGKFNYQECSAARRYLRSAAAHNVLLVDRTAFEFHPVWLVDSGRGPEGDFVVARHDLPQARHVRRLEFSPPRRIRLTDDVESSDGRLHRYAQLFHAAPGLRAQIVSPREAHLLADDGSRCVIRQTAGAGSWSVVCGQNEPVVGGWYSRRFNELVPIATLCFESDVPSYARRFATEIILEPRPTEATAPTAQT